MKTVTYNGYTIEIPDRIQGLPEKYRRRWIAMEAQRKREALIEAWAGPLGLEEDGGLIMVAKLWGRNDGRYYGYRPPYNTHASLWNFDGKPAVHVYQPYDLTAADEDDIRAFAESHGLYCFILDGPGWHCPGVVRHVELWNKAQYYRAMKHARRWIDEQVAKRRDDLRHLVERESIRGPIMPGL